MHGDGTVAVPSNISAGSSGTAHTVADADTNKGSTALDEHRQPLEQAWMAQSPSKPPTAASDSERSRSGWPDGTQRSDPPGTPAGDTSMIGGCSAAMVESLDACVVECDAASTRPNSRALPAVDEDGRVGAAGGGTQTDIGSLRAQLKTAVAPAVAAPVKVYTRTADGTLQVANLADAGSSASSSKTL